MSYFVYILRCADDTLYVGSTHNVEKRLHQHNNLKSGAHYTKIRRPLICVYQEVCDTYAHARSREAQLKQMSRTQKIHIIESSMKKISMSENIKKDVQPKNIFTHEVILCFDNVRSVQNVATLFRVMDCVGIKKCVLGGITPGPLDRFGRTRNDFAKISLGAEKTIFWESVENILPTIKKYKKEGFEIVALEQTKNSILYTDFKITKPTVLFLGAEVEGVSKAVLKHCDTCIEIPMLGQKESLNVAVAGAITLFRLRDF